MKTCLVTGGAGFIGSHLAEELVRRGERVRVLDNFITGKRENLAPFRNFIELIEGDIRDKETCRKALRGVDYVLHQAALTSVPRSVSDPLLNHDININGTLNLLFASQEAKVKRFVFASSAAVYGDSQALPLREGNEGAPLSPYALSKLVGEKYCQLFYQLYGLETICLRYFNVFGPRQDPLSEYATVIPLFINKVLAEERPPIYGDGEQSRDFIFVADAVEANMGAVEAPDEALGGVFNIAGGERTTVNSLVHDISDILGISIVPLYADPRPGDILHSFADIGKARRVLGYEPMVGFKQGLRKTTAWYKERR
jgi:UDP-N-acetylglucosamine/UDP-N-acetyl-alpha-D-glucosaminouronate 4-epimerase